MTGRSLRSRGRFGAQPSPASPTGSLSAVSVARGPAAGHASIGEWESRYVEARTLAPRHSASFEFIRQHAGFTESLDSLRRRIYGLHYWDDGPYDLEILDARMDYTWEVDGVRFGVWSYVKFRIWDEVYEASGPVFERFREIGVVRDGKVQEL